MLHDCPVAEVAEPGTIDLGDPLTCASDVVTRQAQFLSSPREAKRATGPWSLYEVVGIDHKACALWTLHPSNP
jgi:hypothetical protein